MLRLILVNTPSGKIKGDTQMRGQLDGRVNRVNQVISVRLLLKGFYFVCTGTDDYYRMSAKLKCDKL